MANEINIKIDINKLKKQAEANMKRKLTMWMNEHIEKKVEEMLVGFFNRNANMLREIYENEIKKQTKVHAKSDISVFQNASNDEKVL